MPTNKNKNANDDFDDDENEDDFEGENKNEDEDKDAEKEDASESNYLNIGDLETKNKKEESGVVISKSKIALIYNLLRNIKDNTERLNEIVSVFAPLAEEERIKITEISDDASEEEGEGRVIEGVFDGESMIGPDGKQYSIPANYASKSKLVEGDIMKLTITTNGTFIYKQIGPIERLRVVGILEKTSDGGFTVVADAKRWRILTASVTYFRGNIGDEVIILVPKTGESNWAAVENIVKTANNI